MGKHRLDEHAPDIAGWFDEIEPLLQVSLLLIVVLLAGAAA